MFIRIIVVVLTRLFSTDEPGALSRATIERALLRLGELASDAGEHVSLVVVGGAALVLGYNARTSTRDVDAYLIVPPERRLTRTWVRAVARELGLPQDWLNDGATGFMQGVARGPVLLSGRGIMVYQAAPEQLLAMKLAAWRDIYDQTDASTLFRVVRSHYAGKDQLWQAVAAYLTPFDILKASYAFEELWESEGGI